MITYSAETLTLTKMTITKVLVAQGKIERQLLNVTVREKVRNKDWSLRRNIGNHKVKMAMGMWLELLTRDGRRNY